jgi:hypothetical protein
MASLKYFSKLLSSSCMGDLIISKEVIQTHFLSASKIENLIAFCANQNQLADFHQWQSNKLIFIYL